MKLSKKQIEKITKALEKDKQLPEDFKSILFPVTRKEYELVYTDKEREEDVLAETMAVPLQPVKTFGENGKNWNNKLIFGDNLQVLKTFMNDPEVKSKIKLIYIDPPFSTMRDFKGSQEQKAYQDKICGAKFLEFLRKRLIFMRELLSDDGSIYVHLDWKKGHYVKTIMDEIFGEHNFRNDIIWHYRTGNLSEKQFQRKHDILLFYSKSDLPIFIPQEIKEYYFCVYGPDFKPGFEGRKSGKDKYGEYRISFIDDVWDLSAVFTLSGEHTDYPTQKPETLLVRVVKASSNPGDLILDCFAGSGTTLTVAEKLGRRWIGIDCGKLAIYTIQKRILNISKGKDLENPKEKYSKIYKPFTLYNAGLYDYQKLKALQWEDYRTFALKLFQCRDEKHTVSKIELDGYLGSNDVLIFNYQRHKDVVLDRGFIDDLHASLGNKIGEKFFIISPAANVKFLEDYIEKDKIKYYILRIPYSIINELHQKNFTAIKQPADEMDVNDTVEAVGFDFIQIPEVECEYFLYKSKGKGSFSKNKKCAIKIKKFTSQIISKKPVEFKNRETLSMVMLDYDYDGKVFDIDDVFYAESMQNENYEVRFDKNKIKDEMMIIYVDIFGNEKREVKKSSDFKVKK